MNEVEETIGRFSSGGFVILVDDPERENEGDLLLSADFVTAELSIKKMFIEIRKNVSNLLVYV